MMYQFIRVTAKGTEQIFNDVKGAFEGKETTDTVFVQVFWNWVDRRVWSGKRFRVTRAE